jgi:hypothetical protein
MTTVVMRQQGFSRAAVWFAILTALAGTAAGCKSGTSWTAKPSWWTFGGGTPDAAKLADAPPAGDVSKPSATAKPYPTTSTPEGYVLSDKQRVEQASAAAVPQSPPPAATAVTYGSTPPPPPTASTPAVPQGPAAGLPAGGGLSSITPQVGPYGSPSAGSSAIDSLPATASAAAAPPVAPMQQPAASAYPAAAAIPAAAVPAEQRFGSPAERVADARSAPSWQPPAETAPQASGSRYDTATGSRFSGGGFSAPPPTPAADPFAGQAPAAMLPPAASSLPAAAGATLSPPAVPPPPAMPATLPPAAAPSVPTRRPDPGYRPGGTSSYRPSRTILAGGTDAVDSAVQPASYQAELPAAR